MKIRIIKADKTKWYHNRIGKVYVVVRIQEVSGIMRVIIRNYRTIWRFIDYDDVEIIEK